MLHPNNFKCKTYWLYSEDSKTVEEPEQRTAQYEMGVEDLGYGKKLWIKIFSRTGTDPLHKRDYYNYFEFPIDCTFTTALMDIIGRDLMNVNRT